MFPRALVVFMCCLLSGIGFASLGAPAPAATGSHTLTVVTTGVCVLNKDSSGAWSVLMPRATAPVKTVNLPNDPTPGHRPYLAVYLLGEKEDLFPGNVRKPDLEGPRARIPERSGAGQYLAVFYLDNEWLSLRGAKPQGKGGGKIPPEIVSMREVCCIAAKTPPTTDTKELITQVKLGPGNLQTGIWTKQQMVFKPPREACPGTSSPAASGPRRLAQEIILKLGFNDGALVFSKIKGNEKSIEFSNLARDVTIEIGNTPDEDILHGGIPPEERDDHHFELFYNLIPRAAGSKPHPRSTPHVPSLEFRGTKPGGTGCPPVVWP